MVRIRLKQAGRRNRKFWHIVATDQRSPRDGRVFETLGTYDPMVKDPVEQVSAKKDRIEHWLSKGAKASVEVAAILKRVGITTKGC